MQGYILIDKPLNWTSFDVVKKVKGITKTKVGHAGTLDPLATGLLILLLGPYTKKADQFLKLDKTYLATIELGSISATDDAEGEIKHKTDKQIPQEEVEKAIKSFIGKQKQVPPQFSAVKVGGQKAYNRARAGKTTKLDPRDIQIYSIEDINYSWPTLSFVTEVSSGTYIRSLA